MTRALPLLLALALVAACLWLAAGQAHGYVSIRVPVGSPGQALAVRWDLSNAASRPNVANRRVLYEIDDKGTVDAAGFQGPINEFEAVQNSFNQWRNIMESELDFEFTGATTNATTDANDNRNVIRWVSSNISAGVFALTVTTFETTTGKIVDADMVLNDRDFTWDTLGPTATQGIIGRAMIENVVTHEIGHFVGLDHASNARASLFFQSGPGLISSVSLEADDIAPIISDYPSPDHSNPRLGSVAGMVDNGTAGQFGVEVLLVDLATGRNVVGSITEGTPGPFTLGTYSIKSVPPGNYAVLCWPTNRDALNTYYKTTAFTNFLPVVRGVAANTVGAPNLLRVAPGQAVTGIDVTLPAMATNTFEPNGSSAQAKQIDSGQVAVSTITPASDEDWFKYTTTQPNQVARIRVLADAFGSGLNPTLTLLDTNGTTVLASPDFGHPAFMASANDIDSAAFDASGPNFDAEIVRTMALAGTYFVKVASRVAATSGHYLLTVEVEGADVAADVNLSAISASVPGIAVGGGNFTVTVTPRNLFGRDLNAPNVFTVELLDVTTSTPVVLSTQTNASTPFNFTVAALGTSQVRRYGARIGGVQIAESVQVSHFSSLSPGNSRAVALEKTIVGNGYDTVRLRVDLRDGSNNPFRDPAAVVLVSTSLGAISNGTTSGASGIAATFDPPLGAWFCTLVAPTGTGTANISATANAAALGTGATVLVLARATGTGSQPVPPTSDEEGKKKSGGGCVSGGDAAVLAILGLVVFAVLRRRRSA
ncbi:MAG: matrixin family metalloprotease [Planctomycetes bacterium]|nr:matrixin family metalloprotease [Planctomycetota bacterium]